MVAGRSPYRPDVTDRDAVFALRRPGRGQMGSVDVMVANAGIAQVKTLLELTPETCGGSSRSTSSASSTASRPRPRRYAQGTGGRSSMPPPSPRTAGFDLLGHPAPPSSGSGRSPRPPRRSWRRTRSRSTPTARRRRHRHVGADRRADGPRPGTAKGETRPSSAAHRAGPGADTRRRRRVVPTSPDPIRIHDRTSGHHRRRDRDGMTGTLPEPHQPGAHPGPAARRLPHDADHPRRSRTGCTTSSPPATSPASCTCTPARRRRPPASARTSTDRDTIASTHRGHGHCIAKGVDIKPDDGRDLRQDHRVLPRQGRLDAHRRPVQGHARRQRHRRRRPAADLRRRAGRQASRATAASASRSSATARPTRARRSRR